MHILGILVPFAAFGQTLAEKCCSAAHISFYVEEKLIWDEFSHIAGSFTTVGGSQVELCTWLLGVQHLHSGESASSRNPPTCSSHSRLLDVTRTLVVLSVLTHLCIHVTVCFFRAFVKCTFLCHSGIPADPLFHILWWKSLICMWKDIFSYKTIINQIDTHWIKKSPFFHSFTASWFFCLLSVLFGLLETRSGGVGGVLPSAITRVGGTRVEVESHTGTAQKAEEMCQFGSCQLCHSVCHFGSSFVNGWTSASDRRNIPVFQTLLL